MKNKELLFSVTIKDCDIQTFRSGGPGGQHQNKTSSGVRVIHRESGAVGESRETRNQHQNKKQAFLRMAETKEFKNWLKMETARKTGAVEAAKGRVEKMMEPKNLKIEVLNENGKWAVIGHL